MNTVYVSNLPVETHEEELVKIFSDVGPLKKCFIVERKQTTSKTPVGYARFALEVDVAKALKANLSLHGVKLKVQLADPNHQKRTSHYEVKARARLERQIAAWKRRQSGTADDAVEDDTSSSEDEIFKKSAVKKKQKKEKKVKEDIENQVTIRNLSYKVTSDELSQIFSAHGEIAEIAIPTKENGSSLGIGFVKFKSKEDCSKAINKHHGTMLKDRLVAVTFTDEAMEKKMARSKRQDAPKAARTKAGSKYQDFRLIVRNLSFKCSEKLLKKTFEKYGNLTDHVIPRKKDNQTHGFGFVQYTNKENAQKAIAAMHGKTIIDRAVNVSFCVAKSKPESMKEAVESYTKTNDGNHQRFNDSDSESEDETPKKLLKKRKAPEKKESKVQLKKYDDSDSDMDSDDDTSDLDMSDMSSSESEEEEAPPPKKVFRESDVGQGKTVFVTNLSFDTTEEEIGEHFEKAYGEIEYCRITKNKVTDRSLSSAFIKFESEESAEKCIRDFKYKSFDGGMSIDGRKINIRMALSQQKVVEMNEGKKKRITVDRRNMWLAKEGFIRAGTASATECSKDDLKKRQRIMENKMKTLKNPNFFVSTHRLCFHNLPPLLTDKELKTDILKLMRDSRPRISECRIMRDLTKVDEKGHGRSKGFAFVNFETHTQAMDALKKFNNNGNLYGNNQRPIVDFSIESTAALLIKARRAEKQQRIAEEHRQEELRKEALALRKKREKQEEDKANEFNPFYNTTPKTDVFSRRKKSNTEILNQELGLDIAGKPRNTNQKKKLSKGQRVNVKRQFEPKVRNRQQSAPKAPKGFKKAGGVRKVKEKVVKQPKKKIVRADGFDKLISNYKNVMKKNSGAKWDE